MDLSIRIGQVSHICLEQEEYILTISIHHINFDRILIASFKNFIFVCIQKHSHILHAAARLHISAIQVQYLSSKSKVML